VRTVLANDISHSACEAMRMNVDYNNAGPSAEPPMETTAAPEPPAELSPEEQAMNADNAVKQEAGEPSRRRPGCDGYVAVNENDAWLVGHCIPLGTS
jgi:tRNA (guanine26-N2/guanine27-N2)-dimethyltransferase